MPEVNKTAKAKLMLEIVTKLMFPQLSKKEMLNILDQAKELIKKTDI